MRLLARVIVIGIGVVLVVACAGLGGIFFYAHDLPDMKALAQFAPAKARHVSDPCLADASVAIPYESIGQNLRAALSSVEANEKDAGALGEMYRGFRDQSSPHRSTISLQISRSMFCVPARALNREVAELRTAVQLERHFSRQELFTVFANRAWFGDGQVGVEAASQHFFRKEPSQLQVGEAALLAGLIGAPARFSPLAHPDRAVQRRNEVIDAMIAAQAIGAKEGEAAKVGDLGIAAK